MNSRFIYAKPTDVRFISASAYFGLGGNSYGGRAAPSGSRPSLGHRAALWKVAQAYQLTRPLPAKFGIEGPTVGGANLNQAKVTAANPQGEAGINLSNGKIKASLWGPCDRLTLSISKTDVYDRTSAKPGTEWKWEEGHSPRPVGQLLLLAPDFEGATQPQVSTALHNGVNSFTMTSGTKTAHLSYLASRSQTNVLVIKGDYAGLTEPVFVRVFSFHHQGAENPQAGNDGVFFWVRQSLPAERTFPNGFDYYLVAKVVGTDFALKNDDGQTGLGSPTFGQDAGSAASARLPSGAAASFLVYATVVTRAETADPLAEAKRPHRGRGTIGPGPNRGRQPAVVSRPLRAERTRPDLHRGAFQQPEGHPLAILLPG